MVVLVGTSILYLYFLLEKFHIDTAAVNVERIEYMHQKMSYSNHASEDEMKKEKIIISSSLKTIIHRASQ